MKKKQHNILKVVASIVFIIVVMCFSGIVYLRRDIVSYNDGYGYLGVFMLCFVCNASLFFPAPSIAVAIVAAQSLSPLVVIVCATTGATVGELIGYYSGKAGKEIVEKEGRITQWIKSKGAVAVFLFALIPLPLFDFAGVCSGYSGMRLHVFIIACLIGKLIKMGIYVYTSVEFIDFIV